MTDPVQGPFKIFFPVQITKGAKEKSAKEQRRKGVKSKSLPVIFR